MKFTLKQARDYAGFTQDEVAKKLGIATVTYGKYERGENEIKVKAAKNFSKIVGIKFDDLIFPDEKVHVS